MFWRGGGGAVIAAPIHNNIQNWCYRTRVERNAFCTLNPHCSKAADVQLWILKVSHPTGAGSFRLPECCFSLPTPTCFTNSQHPAAARGFQRTSFGSSFETRPTSLLQQAAGKDWRVQLHHPSLPAPDHHPSLSPHNSLSRASKSSAYETQFLRYTCHATQFDKK